MKTFGGTCLVAIALLLPTQVSAGGSIITLKATESTRSIIFLGDPAPCAGLCLQQSAETDPVGTTQVSVDDIALAAMPRDVVPPVAHDETTASVERDPEGDERTIDLFANEDLRPGNQDMMP